MALQAVATHCKGARRDGQSCTNTILLPSGFCHFHDPERQAGLAAVRVAGGHARSTTARSVKALPVELRGVYDALVELVDQVRTARAEPPQATAVAALAGRLLDYARFSLERGETAALERRLEALEAAVAHTRRLA